MSDSHLICPVCKDEKELEEIVERDTPFLGCTTCFGLFVTVTNLITYITKATEPPVAEAFQDLLKSALETTARVGKRTCPSCAKKMERRGFGEAPFVVLDRCLDDHGLWLDKKELKKVLRSSRAHAIAQGLVPMTRKYESLDEEE